MSLSSKQLLETFQKIIPPLTGKLHKGQAGRIAVIGGSEDYTGAPFFAAISALKLGADLSHVFCEKNAGPVIKSYSPELMVHPYLRNTSSIGLDPNDKHRFNNEIDAIVKRVTDMFPRLHVLVIGPGLSRDEVMLESTKRIIEKAREKGMPLVIDADGLFLIQKCPELIKGYPLTVLTPNVNEFKRLCDAVGISADGDGKRLARQLSEALGNVTILQKGQCDVISNGKDTVECDAEGSPRRCGGQGDLLSGACATFLAWGKSYEAQAWDHSTSRVLDKDFQARLPLITSWAAALTTRSCSHAAFAKHGRSMVTTDMIEEAGRVFEATFEPGQRKCVL
ncbi:Ribokinase-like protein [Gaertneriomyces semiglobifer]|nr:Ribokinase-like protein [Gaertneriomyces semiglobifer]